MSRLGVWAYVVGVFCSLATVGVFLLTTTSWWSNGSVYRLFPGEGFWDQNSVIGVEFFLLFIGTGALLLAESDRAESRSGTRARRALGQPVEPGRRSYPARLLWMLVPLASWTAILFVPLVAAFADDREFGSPSEMWFVIGANAFIAAGAFGTMVMSLIKAAFYDRAWRNGDLSMNRERKRVALPQGSDVFGILSASGRLELVFGFIAVGTIGVVPYFWIGDEVAPDVIWVSIVAGTTLVAAVVIAVNSWRSGAYLTSAASPASAAADML